MKQVYDVINQNFEFRSLGWPTKLDINLYNSINILEYLP
jgi:hypothetical protein